MLVCALCTLHELSCHPKPKLVMEPCNLGVYTSTQKGKTRIDQLLSYETIKYYWKEEQVVVDWGIQIYIVLC